MDDMMRGWFALIANKDDLDEALGYMRGFCEEIILSGGRCKIEIWLEPMLGHNIQQPVPHQTISNP